MSSYARKTISFFVFFYTLLMPSSVFNASAENNIKSEDVYTHFKQTSDISELDTSPIIDNTARTVSHILSSSSSELVDQATSYTLNKFNSTVSSEVQKWLSQYGTVGINFGLNREWTLKNNSIDLLLPIYDNQENWLFFSQLGYRNKDSRNTVNLGLGSRYFDKNWMYGLNTFYDYDVTGNNRRLGLGGEIWADYIKFSANTYHRLSNWQESRNFKDYHERPATGYDINGEFFLSAYPNLGMKLTYEQYFGDNVTLFNRETKQKNPSQTKLDLMYTPIPLITIGASYQQGEGHTETQFLTNLNYKFGIPLSAQLSPNNVASMRTLIGSRHDLVERNNYIILDHKKREKDELYKLDPISGYGQQEITVNAPIRSYANIKDISWSVPDKAFKENDGKLTPESGRSIIITLPSYQETHKSDYELDVLITDNQGRKQTVQTTIKVVPFLIDEKVNITSNDKNGYTFSDPIITYRGAPSGEFVKNASINKVTWITDPPLGDESGLEFTWKNGPAKTNDEGKLVDEEGNLILNTLISKKAHEKVVVYIQLDGAPRQEIGTVSFTDNPSAYHIQEEFLTVSPPGPLFVGDGKFYTFSGTVVDRHNNPVKTQEIKTVVWKATDDKGQEVKLTSQTNKTNDSGELIATLDSSQPFNKVTVSLAIENHPAISTKVPVSIESEHVYHIQEEFLAVSPQGPLFVGDGKFYTFSGTVVDRHNNPVKMQEIKTVVWKATDDKGQEVKLTSQTKKTNDSGELIATLDSSQPFNKVTVSLAIENHPAISTKVPVSIESEHAYHIQEEFLAVSPQGPLFVGDGKFYTFSGTVVDRHNNPVKTQEIKTAIWKATDDKGQEVKLTSQTNKTNDSGELIATLDSSKPFNKVTVSLAIENHPAISTKVPVSIESEHAYHIQEEFLAVSPQGPLFVGDGKFYTFSGTVVDRHNNPVKTQEIKTAIWKATDDKGQEVKLTSQTNKTNDSGELIATLDSSQPFNKVTVSLAIENHPAIATKVPVSIQSENITVECKAFGKTPVLVGESYICTAHVTDLDGGIAGEKIVWKVNDPDLQLEPTSEVTDNDGKMTATLTSSKKVLGLVVTASVIEPSGTQSSGESTEDIISFIWPEITINPTSKNPVVVANGQDSYEFTATIWRDKQNNEPYKEPVMKFAWGRPQLQDDTGTTEPNLTPPPDEPLEVNPNDGTLTATMTSLQWGQVKACINIVDRDPASPICSKLVNFALDFEIAKDSVEIYKVNRAGREEVFDPNKPLLGDDKSEYMYRAQIIDKNNKQPVSNYTFSDVNWTRNLPDVTGKQLNIEWDKEGKTNREGYLYATLKSNVGLNKKRVEVTFNMAGISTGSMFSQAAKQTVTFDVSPELAAIRVYKYDPNTGKVDKSVSKSFTEQEKPYNSFSQLVAEFISANGEALIESGDHVRYTPELDWSTPVAIDIHSNRFLIFNDGPGSEEVTLHITKKNGTQQQYTYTFFTRRFFLTNFNMLSGTTLNNGASCENGNMLSPLKPDLVSTGTGTTLYDEFPDAYKFGILDGITIEDINHIYIKMLESRQNSDAGKYLAYDLLTGKQVSGDNSKNFYVLCENNYSQ